MFWPFHPLAVKTNNEHLPKPVFKVIRKSLYGAIYNGQMELFLALNIYWGPIHTYHPDIFVNEYGIGFRKIRASTRSKFLSFLPVHTKTLNYSGNTIASLTGHVLCDEWNHRKLAFSKNSMQGTVFENVRFWCSKTPLACEQKPKTEKKNLRFEKYPDTCGRGLRVFSVYCKGASRLCSKENSKEPSALNLWNPGYPAYDLYDNTELF